MQNIEVVLDYENFLLDILSKVNVYFFGEDYESDESDINNNSMNDNKKNKIDFVASGKNKDIVQFNKKNSQIVKIIVEEKIIDILIFLVLRHFKHKLSVFKKNYFERPWEANKTNDEKKESELKKQRFAFMKSEMDKNCAFILKKLIGFLQNCVQSMNSYNNVKLY